MLSAAQVIAAAERKWPELLRAEAAHEHLFPLHVRLGRPPTTGDFDRIRRDAVALDRAANGWRIEWEDVQTRKWGRQRWPARIVFDSLQDLAHALGRTTELRHVRRALHEARETLPSLEGWLCANAHRLAEHAPYWTSLLAVCAYFDANPQPRCYARQIPAAPDTKFIERHATILVEMLDIVLGERANREGRTFSERFHLQSETPQVRFRFLDDQLRVRNGWPADDCSVPVTSFAGLTWRVPRVVIVENKTVFLCLAPLKDTLAIWGAGKAAVLLAACEWLSGAEVVYWGDCDDAGYGILSALRQRFPHVRSVLMDLRAWTQWNHLAVPGRRDIGSTHEHLLEDERGALTAVLVGPWMLEQERIPPASAQAAVTAAFER